MGQCTEGRGMVRHLLEIMFNCPVRRGFHLWEVENVIFVWLAP